MGQRVDSFWRMRLADRIAQCRVPFLVQNVRDHSVLHLTGATDFAKVILECPMRYVLTDELIRLCTALAYSKGTRTLACADLLHVPAPRVWIEWCEAPCRTELALYGFKCGSEDTQAWGRRGVLIESSLTGRRGLIRTFWAQNDTELDVLAGCMEAYFDFDTAEGEEPVAPDAVDRSAIIIFDDVNGGADVLRRCFRFRYERTWADYYAKAALSPEQRSAIAHHSLGTIAIDIPVVLAFLLLLATRPGLPRRPLMLERLNRVRTRSGKMPLLDHVVVFSPLLPEYRPTSGGESSLTRRAPRLHHVRGHLVRRGSQFFWRVPHLRGSARSGVIRSRTVTWTLDQTQSERATTQYATHSQSHVHLH